jgi:hypothetical protein
MFAMMLVIALCIAGVAFCLRFMVALRGECKRRPIGYWVRLRLHSSEDAIAEPRVQVRTRTRAA